MFPLRSLSLPRVSPPAHLVSSPNVKAVCVSYADFSTIDPFCMEALLVPGNPPRTFVKPHSTAFPGANTPQSFGSFNVASSSPASGGFAFTSAPAAGGLLNTTAPQGAGGGFPFGASTPVSFGAPSPAASPRCLVPASGLTRFKLALPRSGDRPELPSVHPFPLCTSNAKLHTFSE